MLTGDLNAAVVEWVVQYRIAEAEKYLFRVREVEETFRDMSEASMRAVVGDRTVNEVITVGRQEIEDEVKVVLQALCDEYGDWNPGRPRRAPECQPSRSGQGLFQRGQSGRAGEGEAYQRSSSAGESDHPESAR